MELFYLVIGWLGGFGFAAWLWHPGYKAYQFYLNQIDKENQRRQIKYEMS